MLTISNTRDLQLAIPVESKVFPGGEVHPLVDPVIATWASVLLTAHLRSSQDVMELILVVDALRRLRPNVTIHLYIPYLPYARQDRVANRGEALGITVFAKLINDLHCDSVRILDCHSEVGVALLDNCTNIGLPDLISRAYPYPSINWSNMVLVAPDQGAAKKVEALAQALQCPNVVYAVKKRDTLTGKITDTALLPFPEEYLNHDWLVVDDICDGGYTFTELGKLLNQQYMIRGSISLWVTHGIFSKGYDDLRTYYYRVNCTNSFHPAAQANTRPDGEFDNAFYFHNVQDFV